MTDNAKKVLHCYGFLTVVSLLMFLSLFIITTISQKPNDKSIKNLIQNLIAENNFQYQVGNKVQNLFPTIGTSFAYELIDEDENLEYVVAIKITTLSGPVVGVFKSYNSVFGFEYIGNIGINEDKTFLNDWNKISSKQINYYSKQLKKLYEENYEQ